MTKMNYGKQTQKNRFIENYYVPRPIKDRSWVYKVVYCLKYPLLLQHKEHLFLESIKKFNNLSEKQFKWLNNIYTDVKTLTTNDK